MTSQIQKLEKNYPGGLKAYVSNAKELLASSKAGDNPFEGMKPSVPEGEKLSFGSDDFVAAEQAGLKAFRDAAMVLVAGGLGERLGYDGIKVSLPTESVTETSYMELYCKQILARQEASNKLAGGPPKQVPLAIMTSDDTNARTQALFEANHNFGMEDGQVIIMKQEKVAALMDNEAHIAPKDGNPYAIQTKPHGHGDVHQLLAQTGLAKKWAEEGRTHVIFFQDTNALCFLVSVAALGVSIDRKFEVNSVAVPRKAKDAVGAITKLEKEDGTSLTINVEYNQLEPMLKASGYPDGDVNDDTGFSPYPGNINQLVFSIPEYAKVLERTGGLVPEFVNPKYADEEKTKFKKPTRLECMMQDHPRSVGPDALVGFTQFDDWTYSPVKNSIEEAVKKFKAGVPGRCASEGEFEVFESYARQFRMLGADVAEPSGFDVHGMTVQRGPRVVVAPRVSPDFTTLKGVLANPDKIKVSAKSTLVLDATEVVVEGLELDGVLVVKGDPGVKVVLRDVKVADGEWKEERLEDLEDKGEGEPDWVKIRGFKLKREGGVVVKVAGSPGEEVVLTGELTA